MDLTTESPSATQTGLTAGKATAVLITGPGAVRIELQDANNEWVVVHEGASPGVTIPVMVGTQVRASLISLEPSTVTVTQAA